MWPKFSFLFFLVEQDSRHWQNAYLFILIFIIWGDGIKNERRIIFLLKNLHWKMYESQSSCAFPFSILAIQAFESLSFLWNSKERKKEKGHKPIDDVQVLEEKMQPFPKQIPFSLLEVINSFRPRTIITEHSNSKSLQLTQIWEPQAHTEREREKIDLEMATLQKFKLLAMQCGVVQSPTRSPRTSPLVHLPRRKTTLRMLLCRSTSRRSPRQRDSPLQLKHLLDSAEEKEEEKSKDLMRRNSLKDLFVSPLPNQEEGDGEISNSEKIPSRELGSVGSMDLALAVGSVSWRDGSGSPKPVWTGFRYRSLLRKAWRPVLVTIPEWSESCGAKWCNVFHSMPCRISANPIQL